MEDTITSKARKIEPNITCVRFRVGEQPELLEIATGLDEIYEAIGCDTVDAVFTQPSVVDGIVLDCWIDDNGKFDGAEPNRCVFLDSNGLIRWPDDEKDQPVDILFGDFLVMATDVETGESVDIPEEDLIVIEGYFPVMCRKEAEDAYVLSYEPADDGTLTEATPKPSPTAMDMRRMLARKAAHERHANTTVGGVAHGRAH